EVTTTSDEGFTSENEIRGFKTTVDATGEDAPDTLESLVAAYASCYVPALRVGGEQRGVEDLGRIEIHAEGGLDDDEKLESVTFDVRVEEEVDDEKVDEVVERANELCKVHDALKESLGAEVSVETGAF
ncbi:MAG: OsmC family protein, partial [Halobacteria archaeon]|nr:OsmC family protein [Halobacteria archaeon]